MGKKKSSKSAPIVTPDLAKRPASAHPPTKPKRVKGICCVCECICGRYAVYCNEHRPKRGFARHKPGSKKPKSLRAKTLQTKQTVREGVVQAFELLGGATGLARWAKKNDRNRGAFYRMYARMIPRPVTGEDGGPIEVTEIRRVIVDPKPSNMVTLSKEEYSTVNESSGNE